MKLQDLESKPQVEKSQKVFESYFGKKVNFTDISKSQAQHMLDKVRGLIREHRNSSRLHTSERNPNYLKLMVMEQALSARLEEYGMGNTDVMAIDMNDPNVKRTLDKASKGQNLTPDEQKTVSAIATMKQEAKKKKYGKKVMESEVQQAQVVLAAQDMVDRIQATLENVTEMKFKDLPALVDSIRNEVGMTQAQQYMTDASAALDSLISCLQETKTSIESAQGVITGQEPVVPGEGEGDVADLGEPADMDMEVDVEADAEEEPSSDLEASLGRARR
jgi:DNA polymerase III alpha subunit (gram-positive type)